ncbi:MAG: M48 family metallopeptidase [Pirellulaceae bacterium]
MDRRSWIQRAMLTVAGGTSACGCLCGCKSAPVTGRRQLMLIPEQQEVALGHQAFADVVGEGGGPSNSKYQSLVERVGLRLAAVADRQDYQWETRVVVSEEQNAYALPGGKIVVYEGILPICQNEAGLAVVMSHEVAHVLARHGGERMSQQMGVNGVQTALGYVLRNKEQVQQDAWMKAYGMASTYGVVLPYSRKHESEADHIGLMLMARAGYDPAEAPKFWTRFAAASQGEKPAEFMSTHPSDARRASDLENLLPEALDVYRQAATVIGTGELIV